MALLLLVQDDTAGVQFHIDKPRLTIGRGQENDIVLDDELVSKQHAAVEAMLKDDERIEYFVHDLDSTNHCFVNDERVSIRRLAQDDMIRIGKSLFRFIDDADGELDATTKLHKTWLPGVYVARKPRKKS